LEELRHERDLALETKKTLEGDLNQVRVQTTNEQATQIKLLQSKIRDLEASKQE